MRTALALAATIILAACNPTATAATPTTVTVEPAGQCVVQNRTGFTDTERRTIAERQHGLDWWTGLPLPATGWQIDHVLPRQYALCHGLTPAQVHQFDHDLANLVGTAAAVNNAKHNHTPWDGRWQPAVHRCWWADTFQRTAARWQLTFTAEDQAGLDGQLERCTAAA